MAFGLGLCSTAFGLFAVGVMSYVVIWQNRVDHIYEMLAGCSLYLGSGACWMVAGVFYWRRAWKIAIGATVLGLLIPIVLFAIMGSYAR